MISARWLAHPNWAQPRHLVIFGACIRYQSKSSHAHYTVVNLHVWQFFILLLTSNPKCHVIFSKINMNVNWRLPFLLKCYLDVTCLVVHVISISKVVFDKVTSNLKTWNDKLHDSQLLSIWENAWYTIESAHNSVKHLISYFYLLPPLNHIVYHSTIAQ